MTAVVVEFKGKRNRRRIFVEKKGNIAVVSVGERVGALRLKRLLSQFGNDFIFAKRIKKRGLCGFDDTGYRNELIFNLFLQYCKGAPRSISVGVLDVRGEYYCRLIPVIAAVSSVVIYTECEVDDFCRLSLTETGTCPFSTNSKAELYECDVVFSLDGLTGFGKTLFGKGGITTLSERIEFPFFVDDILQKGIDN